jgi:hypothetical protein
MNRVASLKVASKMTPSRNSRIGGCSDRIDTKAFKKKSENILHVYSRRTSSSKGSNGIPVYAQLLEFANTISWSGGNNEKRYINLSSGSRNGKFKCGSLRRIPLARRTTATATITRVTQVDFLNALRRTNEGNLM